MIWRYSNQILICSKLVQQTAIVLDNGKQYFVEQTDPLAQNTGHDQSKAHPGFKAEPSQQSNG